MTFSGALTILMYALTPFLWPIAAGVVALVVVHLLARLRGYRMMAYRCPGASLAAMAAGVSALWWIPAFTHSRLAYVSSVFDWVAMIAAIIGMSLVVWLALHPFSYLLRGRRSRFL
ncbi:DUF5368 family protein [Billgrantia endophytica]|uniref:Uncharacterized protein n=1 Tax=Billgrantia endophytica TaxID=2033802 RepID=A0A2N7TYU9_9GAMM|nr:DUF5368 family protein [Halomonas endophytica]PMR73368.1 hypothetical protein C1H69_18755 [Halomonas endophytica]